MILSFEIKKNFDKYFEPNKLTLKLMKYTLNCEAQNGQKTSPTFPLRTIFCPSFILLFILYTFSHEFFEIWCVLFDILNPLVILRSSFHTKTFLCCFFVKNFLWKTKWKQSFHLGHIFSHFTSIFVSKKSSGNCFRKQIYFEPFVSMLS